MGRVASVVTLHFGNSVHKRGDEPNSAHFVLSGILDIVVSEDVILMRICSGNFFEEAAMMETTHVQPMTTITHTSFLKIFMMQASVLSGRDF